MKSKEEERYFFVAVHSSETVRQIKITKLKILVNPIPFKKFGELWEKSKVLQNRKIEKKPFYAFEEVMALFDLDAPQILIESSDILKISQGETQEMLQGLNPDSIVSRGNFVFTDDRHRPVVDFYLKYIDVENRSNVPIFIKFFLQSHTAIFDVGFHESFLMNLN